MSQSVIVTVTGSRTHSDQMLQPEQPHLVSLVLQSKKALQHGEQLCSRANVASNASAQCVVDVLALDAKVRWLTDAVLEQLKARRVIPFHGVALHLLPLACRQCREKHRRETGTINETDPGLCLPPYSVPRVEVDSRVQDWDVLRVQRTDALDKILEALGSQVVPPDFHQASSGSSLFGSQHSDDGAEGNGRAVPSTSPFERSPTATLRIDQGKRVKYMSDRTNWKTLRDFVDDRAIDDALETMESDRNALDVRFLTHAVG